MQNPYGNETEIFRTRFQGHNALLILTDINVSGRFSISEDLEAGKLYVDARFHGDNFPNTESFITDRFGTSIFIATGTLEGDEIRSLFGNTRREIMDARFIIDLDRQGRFTGVTGPNQRYYTASQWNDHVRQNLQ